MQWLVLGGLSGKLPINNNQKKNLVDVSGSRIMGIMVGNH